MIKKIKVIGLFLLVAAVSLAVLSKLADSNQDEPLPLPYLTKNIKAPRYQSPIVIIGDQMGKNLYRYKESLATKISTGLRKNIAIESFANTNYGLHRTLAELKKLEAWPKLLIYHGGTSEAYEQRFHFEENKDIKNNLAKYNDDWWQTIFMIFPRFSWLAYNRVKKVPLSIKTTADLSSYQNHQLQIRNELIFKLYEMELIDLIKESQIKGSKLILVTTPIKLETKPIKICSKIDIPGAPSLEAINKEIAKQDYKQAFNLAEMRADLLMADADAYHLLAQISLKLGNKRQSIKAYQKANAYDCSLKKPNIIFNAILKKLAKRHQVPLFDFQTYLYRSWQKNSLFLDEQFPQDLYMEKLTGFLAAKIKIMLKI